jgi:cyanate permease
MLRLKEKNYTMIAGFAIAIMALLMPEIVLAATNTDAGIIGDTFLTASSKITKGINIGLILFAVWKWLEFLKDFSFQNAFPAILTPATITFIAWQWQDILALFDLI